MKASDMRKALPDTPDSVKTGVQAALRQATGSEEPRRRIRPARLAALIAAAAVVFVAAGFTIAAAAGAFGEVKEEAQASVNAFEYEQVKAEWRQANWTPWALVNATGTAGGTVFTLDESMLFLQNDPDFYLSAQVFYDGAVEGLRPDLDTFTLTVDDRVLHYDAFCVEQWNCAGVWNDGRRYFDLAFLYENRFPIGSEITLSGTLHTYDAAGNQTGVYGDLSISYTLTQDMVDAMTERNAAEMADAIQQDLENNLARVQQLPDKVTVVNALQNGVTLHEVSLENGRFFYSMTAPSPAGDTTMLYIGGVPVMSEVLWADGQTLYCSAALPYAADALSESWLVALLPISGNEDCGLIFRFDPATQQVKMPAGAELPVWKSEWQGMQNTLPTVFEINDTKVVGGVTVNVEKLEFAYGYWTLYTYLTGNADYHTPQEYAPVITANGVTATVTNEYERYAHLTPFLEGEPPTLIFWTMALPFAPDGNGQTRITIDWPIYDRTAEGEAVLLGTYTLDSTY